MLAIKYKTVNAIIIFVNPREYVSWKFYAMLFVNVKLNGCLLRNSECDISLFLLLVTQTAIL